MFEKIEVYLQLMIERQMFPGCSVGVYSKGHTWIHSCGSLTYDTQSVRVSPDTIFDVASLTKVIPVSCCALKLIEEGLITLDDRLIDSIPEFVGKYREEITVWHLLTQTLEFGFSLSSIKNLRSDEILKAIFSATLQSPPGTTCSYANATSILLGLVLERATGMSLESLAENRIFIPLDMQNTTFSPDKSAVVAPTEYDTWRGRYICGEVHDESAYALRPKIVGSAGLFSTANDLMHVIEMLCNDGWFDNEHFFQKETIKKMYTNALPETIHTIAGLGWELHQPFMGTKCSDSTFGKTGFTGCSMVIDKSRDTGVVILTNHTYPHRRNDRTAINEIRSFVADMVYDIADTMQ